MSHLQKFGLALLLLIGLAPYLVSLNGPFVYDDIDQIVNNPSITEAKGLASVFDSALRRVRVLQNMSFVISWSLTPGSTFSFHIFNLLLHLLNGFLVWRFLTQLPSDRIRKSATIATVLFLIHPLQSQAITYVMGNISLLQFFFYIAALNLAVKKEYVWLTGGLIFISLFAKETCALIPFAILALRWSVGQQELKTALTRFPQLFYFFVGLLLLPVMAALKDPVNMYSRIAGFGIYPAFEYYLTQAYYLLFHLYLLVNPSAQSILHPYPAFDTSILLLGITALIATGAITYILWRKRREQPEFWFLWLFYWISTLPIMVIQLINPFAEYRLYQSNFVIFVFAAVGITKLLEGQRARVRGVVYASLVLLTFIMNTGLQRTWKESISVLQYAQNLYPASATLSTMVGNEFLQHGKKKEAEEEFKKGIELNRNEPLADERFIVMLAYFYHYDIKDSHKALEVLDRSPRHPRMFEGVRPLTDWYGIYLVVLKAVGLQDRYLDMKSKALADYPDLDWDNIVGVRPSIKRI